MQRVKVWDFLFLEKPRSCKSLSKRNSASSSHEHIKSDNEDKECDVIDISDNDSKISSPVDSSQDFVSSSTENNIKEPTLTVEKSPRTRRRRDSNVTTQSLDRPYSDSVEKLRRVLESISDREELIKVALDTMQQELDHSQSAQAEHIRGMVDAHNQHISETKKKQWVKNISL